MVNKYKYLEFSEFLDLALRHALENSSHILYYCWRKNSALNFFTYADSKTSKVSVAHVCLDGYVATTTTSTIVKDTRKYLSAATASSFIDPTADLVSVLFDSKNKTLEYEIADNPPLTIDLNESNHRLFV